MTAPGGRGEAQGILRRRFYGLRGYDALLTTTTARHTVFATPAGEREACFYGLHLSVLDAPSGLFSNMCFDMRQIEMLTD